MTLIVVAAVAFGLGIAADRILFSSRHSDGADEDRPTDGSSRTELRASSTNGPSSGRSNDEADEGREEADQIRDPLHRMIIQLDRGEPVDFTEATTLLEALPAGDRRREFVELLASRWGRQDPEAALAWAEALEGLEARHATERILDQWAETDPASAADYVAQLHPTEQTLDWVHHVSRRWAEQDQSASVAWATARKHPAIRARALRGAVEAWVRNDPEAAGAFASTLELPHQRRAVIEEIGHRWAEQNYFDALSWARNLTGEDRSNATRAILHRLADYSPDLAASHYMELADSLPNPNGREEARRDIARDLASRWAATVPEEAANWAVKLPERGEIRREAVREVAHRWLRLDSLAASEWITGLPQGEVRDAAAGVVVEHIVQTDLESAFAWATSIGNRDRQTHLMHHVLDRWKDSDPDAARSAFTSAQLEPHQREHLNRIFESPEDAE